MAMYYQPSSQIQAADGLQTLYLMNPNYVGYSDTQPPPQTNALFLNPAAAATIHALTPSVMPHAPLPQGQQLVGVPISHDPSSPSPVLCHQEDIPRFHYNIWSLVDQTSNDSQTNMPQQTPRGLSLSLSAHKTGLNTPISSGGRDFPVAGSPSLATTVHSNGVHSVTSSKYLKAAQELLDEVANVGKETRPEEARVKEKTFKDSAAANETGNNDGGGEITTAQRQEIQMKKAKLSSMLDEVEQRCRQYHHQMQIVMASFEQAAGPGSARSYTQLALKTMLKQFKCLKSTISAQIRTLNKTLCEEESLAKKLDGSRLRFVADHHQQRPMQPLGLMQNNAWRPQRGLPERAVSVLRAWLFEHFLHPYPKDTEKQMLSKQTGLTRSQVSNWFINARVRLWKPMVEEMYLEEIKNQQPITSEDNSVKAGAHRQLASKSMARPEYNMDPTPTEISASAATGFGSLHARPGFAHLISSPNIETLPEKNPKRPRNESSPTSRSRFNNYFSSSSSSMAAAVSVKRYGIGDQLDRFSAADQQLAAGFQGNNFSLSLALPPTETSHAAHRNFEFGPMIDPPNARINQAAASHPNVGYQLLDFQSRKQPFPAQLLPDFVA